MKQVRKRLTYANVMASVAVFIALGASAYAATQLKKNSVGTKQIKNNAVTSAKIKKNAVNGAKIADNAITGSKVNAATLGTVPNATNFTNSTNATNWSRYSTAGVVKASVGQNVPLLTIGPFSIVGHCKDLGGGEVEASTMLTTSQAGSSMSSTEAHYLKANFNPGTEAEIDYSVKGTTPETNDDYGGYYTGFTAASADGKTLLSGNMASAVYYYGAQCAFWGHGTNNA